MTARKSRSSSRKSTSRGKTSRKKTKRARTTRKPAPIRVPNLRWPFGHISEERKLDALGTLLALIGVLTLLSLLTATPGSLTAGWVNLLRLTVGWGVFLLPLALTGIGLWLILRHAERIPPFSVERLTGFILLYICLLTVLHALAATPQRAGDLAAAGQGGGYLGSLFLRALWGGLGGAGAAIAILAWLLIALTMLLDISIYELFRRTAPLWDSLSRLWRKTRDRLWARRAQPEEAAQSDLPNGFTPLHRSAPTPQPSGAPIPLSSAAIPTVQWRLPPVSEILDAGLTPESNDEFVTQRARLIEETLASFGAPVRVVEINRGPTITQFGVEPLFIETRSGRTRVRVSKIVSLADDLALALAASRIRIQAPVPGRGYVGIEVPNEEMSLVALRDIIESEVFQKGRTPLRFALGRDVAGHPRLADLTAMPHLLIAGTTGSGKSVCINAILTCLLLHNTPDQLRLVLVDPKRVELSNYNGIPHLLAPVVVELERVVGALQWVMREMDKRYHLFSQSGARNITDYNVRMRMQGEKELPYLVVVIDELADLMMIAPDETERTITRLAQLARATGIHLIIATQRPSVDVVTGLIKANFPARIAFAVASGVDSRVILDQPGAERLLGRGDMLFQAPDAPAPVRLQGVFVADHEIQRLATYWRSQVQQVSPFAIPATARPEGEHLPSGGSFKQTPLWEDMMPEKKEDPLLEEAIDLVRRQGRASVSMLQRRLRIGYTRAARLIDAMEERGIIGPPEGGLGIRPVLDYGPAAPPQDE